MPSLDAVVVLCYGPGQVTKAAGERARQLADTGTRIVLVPAIEPAERFVRRASGGPVAATRQPGRPGLEEALGRTDGVVLLVHDDVLATGATVEALLEEHRTSGAVTVPWNNDRDGALGIGALPPIRQIRNSLEQVAYRTERRKVTRLRPSCLLGRAEQLLRLSPSRLTVARTVLEVFDVDIVAARGAVVAHDSTCLDQVHDAPRLGSQEFLTAVMIVRDEEQALPDCLRSLRQVVDRVVVCDTGSTDRTIEIAEAAGAHVIRRPWRNDFAWARNEALEEARSSAYVLQIDADERLRIEDPEEFRRLLATDLHDTQGLTVRIDNYDGMGRVATRHHAVRLFRPQGVRYTGALHEMPVSTTGGMSLARLTGATIDHHGYAAETIISRGKHERNLEIARAAHEESATPHTALNYARALRSAGLDTGLQRRLLGEVLDGEPTPEVRAHALGLLAAALLGEGEYQEAMAQAGDAIALVPADDLAASAFAEAAAALERWDELRSHIGGRHEQPSRAPYSSSVAAAASTLVHLMRAHLVCDDVRSAARAAEQILEVSPGLAEDQWHDVVSVLSLHEPERSLRLLSETAVSDPSGRIVEAVARVHPPDVAAEFAAGVAQAGTMTPLGTKTGLVAAVVAGRDDLGALLAGGAVVLPPAVIDRLVETAAAREMDDTASALARCVLQGV